MSSAAPAEPSSEPTAGLAGESMSKEELLLQLQQRDQQISKLSQQLGHLRGWMQQLHARVQHNHPKALQNARRIYVGNLPPDANEEALRAFLSDLMIRTGAAVSPGSPIVSCSMTQERGYAFVELRSVEEASNAMRLDGVAWHEVALKIRRPSNYDMATALMLGPVTPDPTVDTAEVEISRVMPEDSPDKLFVGGLPCEWGEEAVKALLTPFGTLKHFNIVMDKVTGNSKGYAFCEYEDESVTERVIAALHGHRAGSKTLTVKRAVEGARQSQSQLMSSMSVPMGEVSMLGAGSGAAGMAISPYSSTSGSAPASGGAAPGGASKLAGRHSYPGGTSGAYVTSASSPTQGSAAAAAPTRNVISGVMIGTLHEGEEEGEAGKGVVSAFQSGQQRASAAADHASTAPSRSKSPPQHTHGPNHGRGHSYQQQHQQVSGSYQYHPSSMPVQSSMMGHMIAIPAAAGGGGAPPHHTAAMVPPPGARVMYASQYPPAQGPMMITTPQVPAHQRQVYSTSPGAGTMGLTHVGVWAQGPTGMPYIMPTAASSRPAPGGRNSHGSTSGGRVHSAGQQQQPGASNASGRRSPS